MTYTPRPGSVAARAVQQLVDGPMQAVDLCAALGIKRTNLKGNIAAAVRAGLLALDLVDGRAWIKLSSAKPIVMRYEPPESTTPPDTGVFHACLHIDGDLDIYPTMEIDGGGFRLNGFQVERLRALLAGDPE